jgi:hypothetical protein
MNKNCAFDNLGREYPVVFKVHYYNQIKHVLRLTQLYMNTSIVLTI